MRKLLGSLVALGVVVGLGMAFSAVAEAGGCCGGCKKAACGADKARLDGQRAVPTPAEFSGTQACGTACTGSAVEDVVAIDDGALALHRRCVSLRGL
jgi:hypothetical protein